MKSSGSFKTSFTEFGPGIILLTKVFTDTLKVEPIGLEFDLGFAFRVVWLVDSEGHDREAIIFQDLQRFIPKNDTLLT